MAKQHTIPQFYLRPFLTNGWVYRKGAPSPRHTRNPRGTAAQHDYYGADKSVDSFNLLVETESAPAVRRLLQDIDSMTGADIVSLSYLLANLYARTCAAIEELRNVEVYWTRQVNEITRLTGEKRFRFVSRELNEESTASLEEINDYATRLIASDGHQLAARDSFLSIPDIAECIRSMSFLIIEAPEESFFVTSDRPLLLRSRFSGSPANVGWRKRDAVGCVALSPDRFLQVFYDKEPCNYQRMARPNEVPSINRQTIMTADLEVYSRFECDEAAEWMTDRIQP
jgi:hypothetical protein